MSSLLWLSRINVESVSSEALNLALAAVSRVAVVERNFPWRIIFSRIGLIYFWRSLQVMHLSSPDVALKVPKLVTLWVEGRYAGHSMTFLPGRTRLPFLFGQRIREITYSVEPEFQKRGFGTFLIAHAVKENRVNRIDIVGLIHEDNRSSLRVFDKFSPNMVKIRRSHSLLQTAYSLDIQDPGIQVGVYDVQEERNRYDENAARVAATLEKSFQPLAFGSAQSPMVLRTPYLCFEEAIRTHVRPNTSVLELGSGTGAFTREIALTGARVVALDISNASLDVLVKRMTFLGLTVESRVGDIACLPAASEEFDFVVSAGSLSYGNKDVVLQQIYRVLKPGGMFICVDSLNNNPIYRLNRFLHYIRGNRSKGTLLNMPSISLIETYRRVFRDVNVTYFGSISFLANPLVLIFGDSGAKRVSDWVDKFVGVKRSAFKFVLIARKADDES